MNVLLYLRARRRKRRPRWKVSSALHDGTSRTPRRHAKASAASQAAPPAAAQQLPQCALQMRNCSTAVLLLLLLALSMLAASAPAARPAAKKPAIPWAERGRVPVAMEGSAMLVIRPLHVMHAPHASGAGPHIPCPRPPLPSRPAGAVPARPPTRRPLAGCRPANQAAPLRPLPCRSSTMPVPRTRCWLVASSSPRSPR
jgi:hypothetical protein